MTQPVVHGYPDWNRVVSTSDVMYLDTNILDTVGRTHGPFFVGHQAAVAITFEATTNPWTLELKFYTDQTVNQLLATRRFDASMTGVELHFAVATLGPWMTAVTTPNAGGGEYVLRLWGSPRPGSFVDTPADVRLLTMTGTGIGIGASLVVDSARIWPGPAVLSVQQRAGTFNFLLHDVTRSGATAQLLRQDMVAGEKFHDVVALANGTPRLTVTNTSGVAQVVDAALSALHHIVRS